MSEINVPKRINKIGSEVIRLFQELEQLMPKSSSTYRLLGDAHMAIGLLFKEIALIGMQHDNDSQKTH